MNAKFTQIHAAADYIGPGAIEVPLYQTEILDIVRRRGIFGQRIKQVPATGHPSRYFEETRFRRLRPLRIRHPRSIVAPIVSPTRIENSVPLKRWSRRSTTTCSTSSSASSSRSLPIAGERPCHTVDGVLRTHDVALWNGTTPA